MKVENGSLMIPICDLLARLEHDDKVELIDSLACEDDVIQMVADQIIQGWTELGSHGYKHTGDATPSTVLDKATREVAEKSGDVAKREIRYLTDTMRRQHAYHEQMRDWAWRMCRLMGDAFYEKRLCPKPPECPNSYDASADMYEVVRTPNKKVPKEVDQADGSFREPQPRLGSCTATLTTRQSMRGY